MRWADGWKQEGMFSSETPANHMLCLLVITACKPHTRRPFGCLLYDGQKLIRHKDRR